jgi:hypothetical protein
MQADEFVQFVAGEPSRIAARAARQFGQPVPRRLAPRDEAVEIREPFLVLGVGARALTWRGCRLRGASTSGSYRRGV